MPDAAQLATACRWEDLCPLPTPDPPRPAVTKHLAVPRSPGAQGYEVRRKRVLGWVQLTPLLCDKGLRDEQS